MKILNKTVRYLYYKATLLCAVLFFCCSASSINSQYKWTNIIGGQWNYVGWDCLTLRDGNFLIVGEKAVKHATLNIFIAQSYLIKYDIRGNILWQKILGDSLFFNYALSAIEDPDGNIYFSSNWNQPRIFKLDRFGNVIWNRTYGLSIIEFGSINFTDDFKKIVILGYHDDGILLTAGLTKIDTTGNEIWSKNFYDKYGYDVHYKSFITTNDGYYIAGTRAGSTFNRKFILKTDTAGNVIWQKLLNRNVVFLSICQISDYSFIATGAEGKLYYLKFNVHGDTIWQKIYNIDSIAAGFSIVKTLNNKFAIATSAYEKNAKFVIIDSLGNLISTFTHIYSPNDLIEYHSIDIATDSGYIITGYIEPNNTGKVDIITVKTDKFGQTLPPIGIYNIHNNFPKYFKLYQNFPNPFNPVTTIRFDIPKNSQVTIRIYNVLGKEVFSINEYKLAGSYEVKFDGSNLASGMYFYSLETNGYKDTKKMVLLK